LRGVFGAAQPPPQIHLVSHGQLRVRAGSGAAGVAHRLAVAARDRTVCAGQAIVARETRLQARALQAQGSGFQIVIARQHIVHQRLQTWISEVSPPRIGSDIDSHDGGRGLHARLARFVDDGALAVPGGDRLFGAAKGRGAARRHHRENEDEQVSFAPEV
jgi:hypothetical protein